MHDGIVTTIIKREVTIQEAKIGTLVELREDKDPTQHLLPEYIADLEAGLQVVEVDPNKMYYYLKRRDGIPIGGGRDSSVRRGMWTAHYEDPVIIAFARFYENDLVWEYYKSERLDLVEA